MTAVAMLASAAFAQSLPKPVAAAEAYPNKPIRLLVGSSPGGGAEITARAVAQRLGEQLGYPVIVDNRGGGGGVIALEILAQARPDGYTIYSGSAFVVTATPMKKVAFDTRKVFAPIVQMTSSSTLLLVVSSLQISTVKELIAYARGKPGALSYASVGVGSTAHLGTELFKFMAGGLNMVHVPYKGYGQAFADLLGGQIHIALSSGLAASAHLKSGKLKVIAVTGQRRMQAYPDIPTVSESGLPGFNIESMYGLYAPAGVPSSRIAMLNREVSQFITSPEVKAKFAADGAEVVPANTPAEFREAFIREVTKWETFFKKSTVNID